MFLVALFCIHFTLLPCYFLREAINLSGCKTRIPSCAFKNPIFRFREFVHIEDKCFKISAPHFRSSEVGRENANFRLGRQWTDRVFVRDFFVFLQDKSSSNIFAEEFRKSNISETQGCCHDLFASVGYSPPACARYPGNQLMCMKTAQNSADPGALFLWMIGQALQMHRALETHAYVGIG